MPERSPLWRSHASALRKARRAFRQNETEGLHDVRVALRRIGATAAALEKKKVARNSKRLVRRLSDHRQLEVDRQLLSRIAAQGLLSREAATSLDAQWDVLLRRGAREAARVADGQDFRWLARKLVKLSRAPQSRVLKELMNAFREGKQALAAAPDGKSDRALHRYRLAVKRARYLTEDLASSGVQGLEEEIARSKSVQTAIGRWNDLRLFLRRLEETRGRAEKEGAVTLSSEIGRLASILEGTEASARKDAVRAAKQMSNVVPLVGRTA